MSLALLQKAVAALTNNENIEAESMLKACLNAGFDSPAVYGNLAVALKRQGKYTESLQCIDNALKTTREAGTLANLCNVLRLLKRYDESIKAGLESVAIEDNANARTNLAIAYMSTGEIDLAVKNAEQAIEMDADNAQALLVLYQGFYKKKGILSAEPYLQRALAANADDEDVQLAFVDHQAATGNPEHAVSQYLMKKEENSLRDDQECTLAKLLCTVGRQDEAIDILQSIIKTGQHDASPHRQLVQITDYREEHNQWLVDDLFSTDLEERCTTTGQRRALVGAQALVREKCKDYASAAKLLREKLDLQESQSDPWSDLKRFRVIIQDEIEAYSTSLVHHRSEVKDLSRKKVDSSKYIFIVGLPRCGSTLLETILALNKDCTDLGESYTMGQALAPAREAGNITTAQMAGLGQRYKHFAERWAGNKESRFYTDKMLFNFLHIGTIDMVLPDAKIILCRRNPLDQVLSIVKEDFASGNEYSANLECIAEMICLYYRTIDFYASQLGDANLIEYNYDELVTNPSKLIPQLIAKLGWQWNSQYLTPELSSRNVVTASVNQARKPISPSSVKGWKRYEDLLRPAQAIFDRDGIPY